MWVKESGNIYVGVTVATVVTVGVRKPVQKAEAAAPSFFSADTQNLAWALQIGSLNACSSRTASENAASVKKRNVRRNFEANVKCIVTESFNGDVYMIGTGCCKKMILKVGSKEQDKFLGMSVYKLWY